MISTWNESLKIGIPLLDFQHKQLLDQMDTLMEALEKNKGKQELKSILSFLEMYVNNHFQYEESCMDIYKCPVGCTNKGAHAQFRNNLETISQTITKSIKQNKPVKIISIEVKSKLLDWFVNHIKNIDIKLEPYVKK